jgi:hypothetical protein
MLHVTSITCVSVPHTQHTLPPLTTTTTTAVKTSIQQHCNIFLTVVSLLLLLASLAWRASLPLLLLLHGWGLVVVVLVVVGVCEQECLAVCSLLFKQQGLLRFRGLEHLGAGRCNTRYVIQCGTVFLL